MGACRETPHPDVPALTTAHPGAVAPPSSAAVVDAASAASSEPNEAGAARPTKPTAVAFLEGSKTLEPPVCSRLFVVAVRGTVKAGADTLSPGDVLVVEHPEPIEVKAPGLAVHAVQELDCSASSRPPGAKTLIRSKDVPELTWAGGAMHAHLDVGPKVSPNLYLGRLEGTAPVAEHQHATSSETLVAIEAAGTFTFDGKESRLGPRQIVHIPKGTRHAWKPDVGSKLVAIQFYEPPGPEQRFVALAAAEKDAGADSGKR